MTYARQLLAVCASIALVAQGGRAQPTPPPDEASRDSLRAGGAFLRSDAATSVGLRWVAAKHLASGWRGDVLPRRGHLEFRTAGTMALDADAHAEPITVEVGGGLFTSLYKAGSFSDDPNEPSRGGFNLGALRLLARAEGEGQQGVRTTNLKGGAVLRYTNSDRVWPIIPSLDVSYDLVRPLREDTTDAAATDDHARVAASAFWAIPVFASPFRLFGELHHWELEDADSTTLSAGTWGGASLAWSRPFTVGDFEVPSVFIRWTGGGQPLVQRDRRTWSLGIVAFRRREGDG